MDPFRLCLTFGPVAVYLLLLAALNLSRRAFLVSGTRDAAALGLTVAGFVMVGPVQLFLPEAAMLHLRPYLWAMVVALYGFSLILVLLTMRPRLVIYNISLDQLRPILADLVERLDPDARWAGDSLVLPGLGVQLYVEQWAWMRNISLVSSGPQQDYQGWRRLELALRAALAHVDVSRNPRGISLLSGGVFLLAALIWSVARDPQTVARALFEMLQF